MRLILAAAFLIAFGFQAEAKIEICNKFKHPVKVALAFEQSGEWVTDGWIEIDTDKCVIDEKHPNLTSFYYYGETDTYGQNRWTWGNGREFSVKDRGFRLRNADRPAEDARVAKFSGPKVYWSPETIVKLQFETDLTTTFTVTEHLDPARKVCQYDSGDVAIRACTVLINNDPNKAGAYTNRGIEYADRRDYDAAIADYSRAISLRPDFAVAYVNRGWSFFKGKGDTNRAAADFTTAINLDPRLVAAFVNRGELYRHTHAYEAALKDLDVAISLDPKHNPAIYTRARVYEALGRTGDAIVDYRRSFAINPNDQNTKAALKRLGINS